MIINQLILIKKRFSKTHSYITSISNNPESITVADLVSRGRFPYRKPFKSLGKDDLEIINRSMVKANVEDLANNLVEELSGVKGKEYG